MSALQNNTTGYNNTANGMYSLFNNTSGYQNSALGIYSLYNTTGNNNTAIGYMAGSGITSGSNNIAIGYNVSVYDGTQSNQLNIGDWIYGSNGNVGIGATTPSEKLQVNGNVLATSYLTSSDRNLKTNFLVLTGALAKMLSIHGYAFDWRDTGRHDVGIVAQDVEKVFPDIVKTNTDTGYKSVEYANLIAPMIEAMREQQQMIEKQQQEISELKTAIKELQSK